MENTIYSINGPVVTIKGKTDLEMMEMVYVGKARLESWQGTGTIVVGENESRAASGKTMLSTSRPMRASGNICPKCRRASIHVARVAAIS